MQIEQALLAAGFELESARRLLLAALRDQGDEARPYEYWKPVVEREAADRVADYERDARIRDSLVEEFGTAVENEPAFAPIFRPLERSLPMLSSTEQLRLQASSIDEIKARRNWAGGIASRTTMAAPSYVERQLSGNALFEYQVRESALARALTTLRFDFNEQEFREVFRALQSARPSSTPQVTTASFAELFADERFLRACATALGEARFAEFVRTRDPAFGLLNRIAAERGIRPEVAEQAYALLQSIDARGPGVPSNQITRSIALRELDPETTRKLASVLGADATADLARAFALYRRSFAVGSPLSNAVSLLSDQPLRAQLPTGVAR